VIVSEVKHNTIDFNVIALVDKMLKDAIQVGASDIHVESTIQGLRVRYRIDGLLYDQPTFSAQLALQILSRIKILAHINIAEKRVPHDGKFRLQVQQRDIDMRVSSFPSLHGEKIVIRILDRSRQTIDLEKIGFNARMLEQFQGLMKRSNGFFLVTGPTGSGKTTTLYAALAGLNDSAKHIITLEDPVEYNLDGITQGQIHTDAGFTFERGIRALLRQDPDIAMIGEIRDKQTARIAIEAALTGHLVLSTLHTNDAPSALMRLMDMGIEPFLINASITGILAQRLVRKICVACKEAVFPTAQEEAVIKKWGLMLDQLYKGKGCAECANLGFKGRIGIFELLVVTNDLRSLIVQQPVFEDIYAQALDDGMQTLLHDGMQKVLAGTVSLQELIRVVL
jgi:type II secretory ATPase GspE/PulE/Tfp pilus assembly ATPase PilB-like protein